MIFESRDYFRYYPAAPELRRWGLGITASGFTRIPPRTAYPTKRHPEAHHLDWTHGRVLDALQIVLILSGGGSLETKVTGSRRVEAGMAFLLLPKQWHRYRPDRRTGWEESWIEVQGPVVDGLLEAGTFPPASILRRGVIDTGLDQVLDAIHRQARRGTTGFAPEFSAAALHALALCERMGSPDARASSIQRAVREAERYFVDHQSEPVNVEALAKNLGVGYSNFRRAFRVQTGLSPWRYVLHLRLTRARRLLSASPAKLDDVAARVGFSSGFHLSLAFKQAYGVSPAHWRRANIPAENEAGARAGSE